MNGDKLNLPEDRDTIRESERVGLDEVVTIRDVVRLVEVVNLKDQGFFSEESVLAGSMALRTFGSPRFTVYDADFSTSASAGGDPTTLSDKLRYRGHRLDITPEEVKPDARGSLYQAEPVSFDARFTALIPDPAQAQFKADISYRGLVLPGVETPLNVPYELRLWDEPPVVFVMDPHEIVAEKILGWVVHRQVKHYADLGYIAYVAHHTPEVITLLDHELRNVLDAKLTTMKKLHRDLYAGFPTIDPLIRDLDNPKPILPSGSWRSLQYINNSKTPTATADLIQAIRTYLVPRLRSGGR